MESVSIVGSSAAGNGTAHYAAAAAGATSVPLVRGGSGFVRTGTAAASSLSSPLGATSRFAGSDGIVLSRVAASPINVMPSSGASISSGGGIAGHGRRAEGGVVGATTSYGVPSLSSSSSTARTTLAAITSRMDAMGLGEPLTPGGGLRGGRDSLDAEREFQAAAAAASRGGRDGLGADPFGASRGAKPRADRIEPVAALNSLGNSRGGALGGVGGDGVGGGYSSASAALSRTLAAGAMAPGGSVLSRTFAGYERSFAPPAAIGSQGDMLRTAKSVRGSPATTSPVGAAMLGKSTTGGIGGVVGSGRGFAAAGNGGTVASPSGILPRK